MVWPVGSIAALTVLAGCRPLILGVIGIVTAVQMRGQAKRIPSGV